MRLLMSIAYGATLVVAMTAPAAASAIYEVDEDRDGRVDSLLILEQSDSLA